MTAKRCPVCNPINSEAPVSRADLAIECKNCGKYAITFQAELALRGYLSSHARPLLRHVIRRMQRANSSPKITSHLLETIFSNERLPTPLEQSNYLTLWLGDNTVDPGALQSIDLDAIAAVIGAQSQSGVLYIARDLERLGLVDREASANSERWRLSLDGWRHYDQLKRGHTDSLKAFMAMQFNDPQLDDVFAKIFVPAVKETAFDLVRLTDQPRAGLIDDRLRTEIMTARFVISDLTHENAGAYWEAGFAEGLGKPVIYTCRADKFEEQSSHFDTNHHLKVMWDPANLGKAAEELKATIRATLVGEAKMYDE